MTFGPFNTHGGVSNAVRRSDGGVVTPGEWSRKRVTLHNGHYRRGLCKTPAILRFMRRILCAAMMVLAAIGLVALPAGADLVGASGPPGTTLSFDYSDNTSPPSASSGTFNIIVDVLPAHTPGVVRLVAIAPTSANQPNLVCPFQTISYSQVECAINFSASGVWTIRADYSDSSKDQVSATAVANLRVGN